MWLPAELIPNVLDTYLTEVLLTKSASNTQAFVAAMALGVLGNKLKNEALSGNYTSLGLTDAKGRVDIDALHEYAKAAIAKSGGKAGIPVIGYVADADDIDRIYAYAKEYSEEA